MIETETAVSSWARSWTNCWGAKHGDDGLGGDDGLDGGRVDGVLSYADNWDGGDSTLAMKTTMARRRLQKAILEELLGGFLSRVFNSFKSQPSFSFLRLGLTVAVLGSSHGVVEFLACFTISKAKEQ